MAPRSRKAPPTLKTASKAPQVKLPEKHHWYFDKQNVGSKEYGEIVNAFFPDGEAISDMVTYAVVSYCFEAVRNDKGFDVCAVVKGFVQLKSPVKCNKEQFYEMFGIEVNAYEPDDLIYTTPESGIQPDSFRMIVLCHHVGFKEGGEIRRRGPKLTTEAESISNSGEIKPVINFSEDLMSSEWVFPLPTKEKKKVCSNGTVTKINDSDVSTSRNFPVIASPSVAVGRVVSGTTLVKSGSHTDRRLQKSIEDMSAFAVSPVENMDDRKKAARRVTQRSPHPERLSSPLVSSLAISSNGKKDGNVSIQTPTNSVELLVMEEKETKRQQLRSIFPNASDAVLDNMLAQSVPMSIPSAEEIEENIIDNHNMEPNNSQRDL
jgi:hypothetical protein